MHRTAEKGVIRANFPRASRSIGPYKVMNFIVRMGLSKRSKSVPMISKTFKRLHNVLK